MSIDPPRLSGPVALAAVLVLALLGAGAVARARGAFGVEREPLRSLAPAPTSAARPIVPVLDPDPRRLLADVVRPGRPAVLVRLRPGARLADLLLAAGLPGDTPVEGAPPGGAPVLPGTRLILRDPGRPRLGCMPADRRLRLGLPLDLNSDGPGDLRRLPGVGPVLAARIVADRARRGPYPSVRSLARVKGLGPAMVARIEPRAVAVAGARCAGGAS